MFAQRTVLIVAVFVGVTWMASQQALAAKAEKLRSYMALARISMIDAIQTVESQTGGKVFKAELKEDDGQIYYQIEFVVGDQTVKTRVDAVIVPRAVPAVRLVPVQPPPPPAPRRQGPPPAPEADQPQRPQANMMPMPTTPIEPSTPQPTQPTPMPASGIVIPFDTESAGSVPAGFVTAETSGTGKPAAWKIVADDTAPSQPNNIQVAENPNRGATFSLLIANQPVLADLETSVKIKALGGQESPGAGLIWRYQDSANYYVAAWSKTDNALDVWRIKDGKRKRIGTGVVDADTSGWHEIRVEMKGDRINAFFDGKKMISERDFTFAEPGKVGLWVMADSKAAFDDLTVTGINVEAADPK